MVKRVKRTDYVSDEDDGFKYKRLKHSTRGVPSTTRNETIKPFSAEEATRVLPSLESLRLEGLTEEDKFCKIMDAIFEANYFEYVTRSYPEQTTLCLTVNKIMGTLSAKMHTVAENRKHTKDLQAQAYGSTVPPIARVPLAQPRRKEALLALKTRVEDEERALNESYQHLRMRFTAKALEKEQRFAEDYVNFSDAADIPCADPSDLKARLARANKVLMMEMENLKSNYERVESLCERAEELVHKLSGQLHNDVFTHFDIDSPREFIREAKNI